MPLFTEFALHPSEDTRPTVAKSAAMTRAEDNPILFCSKWVGGGIAPPSPVALQEREVTTAEGMRQHATRWLKEEQRDARHNFTWDFSSAGFSCSFFVPIFIHALNFTKGRNYSARSSLSALEQGVRIVGRGGSSSFSLPLHLG